jgi:hypothetical protein
MNKSFLRVGLAVLEKDNCACDKGTLPMHAAREAP